MQQCALSACINTERVFAEVHTLHATAEGAQIEKGEEGMKAAGEFERAMGLRVMN